MVRPGRAGFDPAGRQAPAQLVVPLSRQRLLSARTARAFPGDGVGEARDAARRLIDRAERAFRRGSGTASALGRAVLTLGGLIDRYEKLRRREGRKIKTLDEAMQLIRRNLAPYLSLPADQFTKADLRAARDAMVGRDAMIAGNRLLQRLGAVMKWGAQEDLIPANFVPDIRKAPEQKRTRRLSDAEIRKIWPPAATISAPARRRRTSAAWCASCWSRPSGSTRRRRFGTGIFSTACGGRPTTRSSRPHALKLPPLALSLIGQGGARDFVFAGSVGKISGFSKLKTALDEASASLGGDCTICAGPRRRGCRVSAFPTTSCRAFSTTRCPASAATICKTNWSSRRPRRWRPGPRR